MKKKLDIMGETINVIVLPTNSNHGPEVWPSGV